LRWQHFLGLKPEVKRLLYGSFDEKATVTQDFTKTKLKAYQFLVVQGLHLMPGYR